MASIFMWKIWSYFLDINVDKPSNVNEEINRIIVNTPEITFAQYLTCIKNKNTHARI